MQPEELGARNKAGLCKCAVLKHLNFTCADGCHRLTIRAGPCSGTSFRQTVPRQRLACIGASAVAALRIGPTWAGLSCEYGQLVEHAHSGTIGFRGRQPRALFTIINPLKQSQTVGSFEVASNTFFSLFKSCFPPIFLDTTEARRLLRVRPTSRHCLAPRLHQAGDSTLPCLPALQRHIRDFSNNRYQVNIAFSPRTSSNTTRQGKFAS
jgi:hypothetical protein